MISVIIPTLNRAMLLDITLSSIARQSMPSDQFEVIVVDNGSRDNTGEVVRNHEKYLQIRYVSETTPGLHAGRHRGMLEAKGDILAYADDDIEAFPQWLETIEKCFEDDKVAIVGGKDLPNYETRPPEWLDDLWVKTGSGKYLTYFSLIDLGDEVIEIDPVYVFGCNFSIRKSVLKEVGGFHPDGMPPSLIRLRGDGETYVADAVRSLGYKTIYHPLASVYHCVPTSRMDQAYIERRAFSDGVSESYRDIRTGKTQKKTFLHRSFGKVRELFLSDLHRAIRKSFQDGYEFHQGEVSRDPELLNWVMKETYLEI